MSSLFGVYDHYFFATAAFFGTLATALGMFWIAQYSRYAERIQVFRGVQPAFLSVVGVLFGLNLVFMANDTWLARDRALSIVFQEAGNLRNLLQLAEALPDSSRTKLTEAVRHYVRVTRDEEWPLLTQRQASPRAAEALQALLSALTTPQVSQSLNSNVYGLMLGQAIQARSARDSRIALSQTHVNPLKWLGVAFLGTITMISLIMVHFGSPQAELAAVLLFAVSAAPTAAIVLVQGNPFQPPAAVAVDPIAELLNKN
ncbi:DUF4239 domain-containing protein [Azospirillaceae bacterium]